MTTYSYTKSPVAIDRLTQEIQTSAIVTALDHINLFGSALDIIFKVDLSPSDQAILDGIVSSHSGFPLPNNAILQTTLTDGNGNTLNQFDIDNALIVRTKAAKKGWTYVALSFQFKLSTPDSVKAMNADGTSKSWVTGNYYNASNTLVTDPALASSVVKTVIDFEPPFDYEVIGGEMRQTANLTDDIWFFIQAAPDIPASYGGSKFMAEGLNLKFLAPGNMFSVDGRVSKLLSYSATNHTNKLRFILIHPAGLDEDLNITVEIYRQ